MAKTTRKTSTRTKATRKRLPQGAAQVLSSTEENVLRMRYGIPETEELGSKASSPELAGMLYAIEARAYEMTGRADPSKGKKPSPRDKIIASLKTKS